MKLKNYSPELISAIGARAAELMPKIASKSADGKALYNSIIGIREDMLDWSTYAEANFLEARKAAQFKPA